MTITIQSNYLVFPVYTYATEKKLIFQHEGETVYTLNLKLDNATPDFYAYIDVSRFMGKDIELLVTPEMEISCRETDEMDLDNLYREANRPQVHFTVKNGFLGNPKGIFYANETYHLFYQYNPAGIEEGNTHLGHAVSKDLIHWQEEKTEVFPNEKGKLDCLGIMKKYSQSENFEIFALSDSEGHQKWVSMDETGKYSVGHIENGQFLSEQPEQILRYGNADCIGQQILLADGRVIRIDGTSWEAARLPFCGQMGIPTELSLKKEEDLYYVQALPIKELEILYKNTNCYENIGIEKTVEIPIADAAHLIRLKGNFDENVILDLILFGRRIRIDFTENQISVGNKNVPISITKKDLDLTLLIDRCSMEIFTDGGKICLASLSAETVMDRNLLNFILNCNIEYKISMLEFHALNPIWQTSPKKN